MLKIFSRLADKRFYSIRLLSKAPKYASRTVPLNYPRDYSFKPERTVSINTLDGRLKVSYDGYDKHLELIANCTAGALLGGTPRPLGGSPDQQHCLKKIGEAEIVYQRSSKTY